MERWPINAGFLADTALRLGGLITNENHMVLINSKGVFERAIAPVLDDFLASVRPGLIRGKTTLSGLMPGCRTRGLHTDIGASNYDDGACDHRFHIPLMTNEKAVFVVEDTAYTMPVGWAYLVNPLIPHAVVNQGEYPRVHLFFNALPNVNN